MELNFNQNVSFTRDIFDGNLMQAEIIARLFRCKMYKFPSKFIAFQVKKFLLFFIFLFIVIYSSD